jgi:hypothetical protein
LHIQNKLLHFMTDGKSLKLPQLVSCASAYFTFLYVSEFTAV